MENIIMENINIDMVEFDKKTTLTLFFVAIIYFFIAIIVGLFHTLHADELVLSYTAYEFAHGRIPGVDFVSQEPLAFFAPIALAYELFSNSIEAERLVLVAMMVTANMAITAVTLRYRGKIAATAAFLMLTMNVPFISAFSILNAQTHSFFGLMCAYAAIMLPRRPDWRHYALAGLFIGFALSSRLAVSLASLVLAAHAAFAGYIQPWNWRHALGRVTAATLGAILMTLPDLAVVLSNPARMVYLRMTVSADMARAVFAMDNVNSAFAKNPMMHLRAYAAYILQDGYHTRLQNTLFPLAVIFAAIYTVFARSMPVLPRLAGIGHEVFWAALFALSLILGYSLTWMQYGDYYNVIYPFGVMIAVGLVTTLLDRLRDAGPDWAVYRRIVVIFAIFLVGLHSVQGFAHGLWQVAWRNTASLGQPQTINRMACWVERVTAADDLILTGSPIIAMIAGRRLPVGLEPSSTLKHWWGDLPPERQEGLPMATPKEFRKVVANGLAALIIDDDQLEPTTRRFVPDYRMLLEQRYQFIGSLGGTLFPLHVYAEREWLTRHPPLPPLPMEVGTTLRSDMLRNGDLNEVVTALAKDLGHSAVTFPDDLKGALARLTSADWNSRCGGFFPQETLQ